jgi:membrane-bound serine protease (ClpP class)
MILLSMAFFVLEAKFATSGILAAGGVLSMVLGALMLINTRLPGGTVSLMTALSVAIPFALITLFLLRLVLRSRSFKLASGTSGMIGELGTVETDLAPVGKVLVHGELWNAYTSAGKVPKENLVRVKRMDGLKLEVEQAHDSHQHSMRESQPKTNKGD